MAKIVNNDNENVTTSTNIVEQFLEENIGKTIEVIEETKPKTTKPKTTKSKTTTPKTKPIKEEKTETTEPIENIEEKVPVVEELNDIIENIGIVEEPVVDEKVSIVEEPVVEEQKNETINNNKKKNVYKQIYTFLGWSID